jgi:hydroxyacylglutathione hydrolase
MLKISSIPACIENYIWLFHSDDTDHVWVLDPGDAELVQSWLEENNKTLAGLLITHHHWDHTDGIEDLLSLNSGRQVAVFGPGKTPLPYTTDFLFEGDEVDIGWLKFEALELPGHTQNHIVYLAIQDDGRPILFCGDVLFSAGCGRLKDGTATQLHNSLERLKSLPDETQLYCGHEYTLANLRFALEVDPENKDAQNYLKQCQDLIERGERTLPSSMAIEKKVNPFLRAHIPSVMAGCEQQFGSAPQNSLECFAALRKWKDNFA